MKLSGKIALCLLGAALATSSAWSQTPAPKNGKNYRIAFIARAQGDSFAAWLADSVTKEIKKYPDTQVTVFDGQSKNELIASHIENAVTSKYDLILLQPLDSEAQVAPVKEAIAAGIKVVTVNNRINDASVPAVDADLLTGKKVASPQFITAELITKENADKFIKMHKDLGNIK